MAVDGGSIKLYFKMETDELEDKLDEAYKDLDKFEKETQNLAKIKLKVETDIDSKKGALERKIKEIKERAEAQIIGVKTDIEAERIDEVAQAKINALTREYEAYVQQANKQVEDINKSIQSNVSSQQKLNKEIDLMNNELDRRDNNEEFNDSLVDASDKARDLKSNIRDVVVRGMGDLNKKVNGIGKSLQGITKKVIGWGLAIFGIRSAYNLVRSSVSQITQNNQELANKLNIIKGALASAIEPIVTRIINLLYTALSFINQIITKLTGKNLFASAKKNLKSGAGSAKEINKQLSSFDEMNVLNDNASGGSGLGDLGSAEKGLLNILEQFKEYFNEGNFGAIAQIISEKIVAVLNSFADKIASIDWAKIGRGISDFLTNIDFSGILVGLVRVFGEAILAFYDMMLAIDWAKVVGNFTKGIADAIMKVSDYVKQIKWDEIGKKLGDVFISIDWVGIGNSILTLLWEGLKGVKDFFLNIDWSKLGTTLSSAANSLWISVQEFFADVDWTVLGADIADAIFDFMSHVDWENLGMNIMLGTLAGIEALVDLVIGIFVELWNKIKEFFGINSPSTLAKDMGINLMQGFVNGIRSMVETVVNIFSDIWNRIKNIFGTVGTWFKTKFQEAWNNIKSIFSSVGTFFGNIWNTIKSKFTTIGTQIGEAVSGAFKGVVNTILKYIESTINTAIKGINTLIKGINVVGKTLKIGTIKELKQLSLPRLAKGGIINMPSKGVMVGGAVAGESGREGVLPLTDSQAMAQLGEAIGRYITINANITNTMNGRVISRELQKINNEDNFAFNG